jgi:hypothetical protein
MSVYVHAIITLCAGAALGPFRQLITDNHYSGTLKRRAGQVSKRP